MASEHFFDELIYKVSTGVGAYFNDGRGQIFVTQKAQKFALRTWAGDSSTVLRAAVTGDRRPLGLMEEGRGLRAEGLTMAEV